MSNEFFISILLIFTATVFILFPTSTCSGRLSIISIYSIIVTMSISCILWFFSNLVFIVLLVLIVLLNIYIRMTNRWQCHLWINKYCVFLYTIPKYCIYILINCKLSLFIHNKFWIISIWSILTYKYKIHICNYSKTFYNTIIIKFTFHLIF